MSAPADAIADLLALRGLVDRYAGAVDGRDTDAFAALFTPDAVLAVYEEGGGEAVVEYRGTAALREVMDLLRHFTTTFHLMANHLCAVDGDAATGEVYCMAHHIVPGDEGETDLVMYIRYRDAYERTGEGWRFARRDVMRQWTEERPAARRPLDV
ncbi:MAG TPA: nuclear transport factor 2 family protein [Miltoncostaeaceae bacterium]|nr:nuclear transport factor 2 family protein [Miltoncostaeaceae bacterium]